VAKITIDNTGVTVDALPGRSLLLSLLNAEQPIHTVCGGKAGCGCCRVRILKGSDKLSPVNDPEKLRLGPEKIAAGWRLACQTHMLRNVVLYLPIAEELDSICSKK
jgi:ferredoxin